MAEVDPEQRHAAGPGPLGRPQHRSVAAQHHDDVRAVGRVLVGRDRHDPGIEAGVAVGRQVIAVLRPRGRPRRQPLPACAPRWRERSAPRRFGGSPRAGRVASLPQRSLRSLRHGPGDRPLQRLADERRGVLPHPAACTAQPEEVLDVTARTGQRARGDAERRRRPSAMAASATPCTADRRSAGSRTTPSPTAARPTSNCGFTISTRSASSVDDGHEGRQDELERDEREVGHDQRRRARARRPARAIARWCAP